MIYKDAETAYYVGLAVHCAKGDSFCSSAQAVKYGQSTPSPQRKRATAVQVATRWRFGAPRKGAETPGP
jgi:hypothetical protein